MLFSRDLARQRPMRRASRRPPARSRGIAPLAEAHLLAQDAQRRVVDARDRHLALVDQTGRCWW